MGWWGWGGISTSFDSLWALTPFPDTHSIIIITLMTKGPYLKLRNCFGKAHEVHKSVMLNQIVRCFQRLTSNAVTEVQDLLVHVNVIVSDSGYQRDVLNTIFHSNRFPWLKNLPRKQVKILVYLQPPYIMPSLYLANVTCGRPLIFAKFGC